jgi:hypothetical protein
MRRSTMEVDDKDETASAYISQSAIWLALISADRIEQT